MNKLKLVASISAIAVLSACMGNTTQTSASIMGMQSIAGVQRAAQAQPTETDLAMNCSQVNGELKSLYARSEEINKAEQARASKANLTSGLLDAGFSVLGAGAIANAGSAQAIANIGTATAAAGTVSSSVRGSSGPDAQAFNEAMAIAERSALLERVKLSKGC